jgi:hypothetical protein
VRQAIVRLLINILRICELNCDCFDPTFIFAFLFERKGLFKLKNTGEVGEWLKPIVC